jgi:hypothetical protein
MTFLNLWVPEILMILTVYTRAHKYPITSIKYALTLLKKAKRKNTDQIMLARKAHPTIFLFISFVFQIRTAVYKLCNPTITTAST